MLPEAQTVHPAQPCPPHWLYLTAEHVDVAVAEVLVVVLEIRVDVADVVELTKVVLRVDVGELETEDEEPLPPDDPLTASVSRLNRRENQCKTSRTYLQVQKHSS